MILTLVTSYPLPVTRPSPPVSLRLSSVNHCKQEAIKFSTGNQAACYCWQPVPRQCFNIYSLSPSYHINHTHTEVKYGRILHYTNH